MKSESITILHGCNKILTKSAKINPHETVTIVTDPKKLEIALPLGEEADRLGAKTSIIIMMPESSKHKEPTDSIAAALVKSDVILLPLSRAITHSKALRQALAEGARAVSLTGFVPDMFKSGAINADFEAIEPKCIKLAALLSEAQTITVQSKGGTSLQMDIKGRHGNAMTGIAKKGKFCPFPNIEANIAPNEGTTKGVAVIDASIPFLGIGIPKHPMILNIEDGNVVSINGKEEANRFREHLKTFNDPLVYNIAEFGIGLNPEAKLRGIVIEDEGVRGTAHIAMGTSASLGGKVQASLHYDLIMRDVTVKIDNKLVVDNGILLEQF